MRDGKIRVANKEGRTLRFQQSHAGRRSTQEHLSTDEWGGTLADVAVGAKSNADMVTSVGHNIVMEELSLPWVMQQLMEDGQ